MFLVVKIDSLPCNRPTPCQEENMLVNRLELIVSLTKIKEEVGSFTNQALGFEHLLNHVAVVPAIRCKLRFTSLSASVRQPVGSRIRIEQQHKESCRHKRPMSLGL
jgi:hypothetical protein